METSNPARVRTYQVWDVPTRVLHWLNAALFLLVAAFGFLFMFRENLEIDGKQAKIALKELHSVLGYALLATVTLRLLWGFSGNRYIRWRRALPDRATLGHARDELAGLLRNESRPQHLGHGPLGRLSTLAMGATLMLALSSGLVRAGTDLYYPPLGGSVARYVAAPSTDPSTLTAFDRERLDPVRAARVNKLKVVAGTLHRLSAWTMLVLFVLHVVGVVVRELRYGGGLASSMITGSKSYRSDQAVVELDP